MSLTVQPSTSTDLGLGTAVGGPDLQQIPSGSHAYYSNQGSHFFGLTKFHDISMTFPGFFSKFPGIFSLYLKYDFQVVLNINMQTY